MTSENILLKNDTPESSGTTPIRKWFYMTVTALLSSLALAWIFYAGQYRFWQNYISHLGGIYVFGEMTNNTISKWIFTIGMWLCGIFSVMMAQIYFRNPEKSQLTKTKGIFLLCMVFGAIFIGCSHDGAFPVMHRIGAAVFFLAFDLYIFFCQFTRYRNKKISFDTGDVKSITLEKFVVIVLLICTGLYFLLIILQVEPLLPIFQKINVILFIIAAFMLDKEDF